MDQRDTLQAGEKFNGLLKEALHNNEPARLLYDNNGLIRTEGLIRELNLQNEKPYMILQDGQQIFIESIIAVNGKFRDNYTEC
ncbi:MAG TPA: hypothetical protein PKE30_17135 [Niabella sp.]|nr:hypothetical protein [Niabella sp.]